MAFASYSIANVAYTVMNHETRTPPSEPEIASIPPGPSFLFFSLFFERLSQIYPWRKDFRKWTQSLALSTLAPSPHVT
jgi:hypothetical protein